MHQINRPASNRPHRKLQTTPCEREDTSQSRRIDPLVHGELEIFLIAICINALRFTVDRPTPFSGVCPPTHIRESKWSTHKTNNIRFVRMADVDTLLIAVDGLTARHSTIKCVQRTQPYNRRHKYWVIGRTMCWRLAVSIFGRHGIVFR